jgi:hypothetical protein
MTDTPQLLALAAALGWASGLRLYAVVFITGLLGLSGWVPMPEGLRVLQHPAVLVASGFMLAVEFFADKIPGIDSLWDLLHSVVRVPAGAALAAAALGADSATMTWVAALLGGSLAATSQAAKTTSRAAINASPEPFSNLLASLTEDGLVVGALWLATAYPLVFAALLAVVVLLMWWLTWTLLRSKILIANRGEIACRVAATARRLGVRTVAVYSDADAHAKHVAACDEAVHIGGSAPKDSYLRWERIIEAAKATGAQAIHPGYGFLSENEDFAQACAGRRPGLHRPAAVGHQGHGPQGRIQAADGKGRRAAGAGLPRCRPGPGPAAARGRPHRLPGADQGQRRRRWQGHARGGRTEDFAAALASCKREAINSFGDDAVLIEKYVQRPRHIEIQVFGDTQGNCVYLFERDCSVQRRHQKVLEEAPAPA